MYRLKSTTIISLLFLTVLGVCWAQLGISCSLSLAQLCLGDTWITGKASALMGLVVYGSYQLRELC